MFKGLPILLNYVKTERLTLQSTFECYFLVQVIKHITKGNGKHIPKREIVSVLNYNSKVKPLLQNNIGLPIYSNLFIMERLTLQYCCKI